MNKYIYILVVLILMFEVDVFSDVLYDIDFSSPTHVVGEQMTVGYGGPVPRNTPSMSMCGFGEQIVVTSYGSLTQQPVQLIPDTPLKHLYGHSQILLDLYTFNYQIYRLDFDVCIENMTAGSWDRFTASFDVPDVVNLKFTNEGNIVVGRHSNPIGSFDFGQLISMSILVDLPENTWSITCNSEHLYTGQFFYPYPNRPHLPGYIRTIRFNLADDLTDSVLAGTSIDNIKVIGISKPEIEEVAVDIKPGSCPNPLNVKSRGVLPVAILGSEEIDVSSINAASIRLAGVGPIRSSYEDVATPVSDSDECNCNINEPDGLLDLTLKFETQKLVEAIGEVDHDDELVLELTGVLSDETPIEGNDCIIIRGKDKPLNRADSDGNGIIYEAEVSGDVLYDIDFSSPTHVVGEQMTVGDGPVPRNTPSMSMFDFGEQIVVTSYGSLTQQPVQLIPDTTSKNLYGYSQMQLDLFTFNYQIYRLDFDVCIENMTAGSWDSFVVLFDIPSVNRLDFTNEGNIVGHSNPIGSFDFGQLLSMSVLVDLAENTWSITCNSEHLQTGQFFYPYPCYPFLPRYIHTIRFNLADDLGDSVVAGAAIDNIKVVGISKPEIEEVAVDIKPGSCPNPLNVKSKGVLPVVTLPHQTIVLQRR
jgi:hypothetical protein